MRVRWLLYFIVSVTIIVTACSKQPQPINYGEEECEF